MFRKLVCCGQVIEIEFISWSKWSIEVVGDEITKLYNSQGGMCITTASAQKISNLLLSGIK